MFVCHCCHESRCCCSRLVPMSCHLRPFRQCLRLLPVAAMRRKDETMSMAMLLLLLLHVTPMKTSAVDCRGKRPQTFCSRPQFGPMSTPEASSSILLQTRRDLSMKTPAIVRAIAGDHEHRSYHHKCQRPGHCQTSVPLALTASSMT